ncbi:bifunctional diguanylate cyclase/phosphodiesterase [Neptuniibacter halophilus]|uniref:bifunctional diguanylate cyclase/phosphodiesterase n=1 Tax=Neptuniibacter halophilus TaxID=651666 RepID=UPI002572F1F1|nr:EAL domain-containing protein [Neptuniibacter halophilus]
MFSHRHRFLGIPLGNSVLSSLVPVGIVILAALVLVGYIWTASEDRHLEEDKQRYAEAFLEQQREQLRSEVTRAKALILRKKAQAEEAMRIALKRRVDYAYGVAEGIYQTYHGQRSDQEIKQMIVAALREVRFNQGRGYYFITSLSGLEYLYPPRPEFEGQQVADIFPPAIQALLEEMINIVTASDQGFVEYDWYQPGEDELSRKYSYVKLFKPYGMIIGSGDYLVHFEEQVKAQIFREIAADSFGLKEEGYFFINSYQGDLYVTNGEYFAGRKNIWEVTDARGRKVVQENARLAQSQPEGGFTQYTWEKAEGVEAEKISFVLGIDEWQLFIGAGAYLDTIDQRLDERETLYLSLMQQRNFGTILVLLLAVLAVAVVLIAIGRRLAHNLRMFQNNLERSVDTWTRLKGSDIHFTEFKRLAVSVNSMIDGLNRQADELRHRAFHDHLTSLPNRLHGSTQLELMISHTLHHQATAALLFIDLDHFKEINDTLGHSAGDELLCQVSERLREAVRDEDIVARLGGDEFTVITGLLNEPEEAGRLAEQLLAAFRQPFRIEGNDYYVTASVGISLFPEDGDSAEILLRNADSAMYEAKREGRNRYCLYTPALTEAVSQRFTITEEMREALDKGQFRIYYQPQYNLFTGELIGAEALLRWFHPERGLIPPDSFIPMAEASGQIVPIGEWVIREVCNRLAQWQEEGIYIPKVAVNIASQQMNTDLVGVVQEVLQSSGCYPAALELEITESSLIENPQQMSAELTKLKATGISLAIDDFGTGYSSLSYLKQLPINKLKIDRSFILDLEEDENDRAITQAIVAMSQSMHLSVIAEGIESEAQVEFLKSLQCTEGQGFFFSKPLPEDAFVELLKQQG